MSRFIYDIFSFLTSRDFSCTHLMRDGQEIISVIMGDAPAKVIIPLEISAYSPTEAQDQTIKVDRCIRSIKSDNNAYPLIITEDRWRTQKETMKARILAHLEIFSPIYARNCEVKRIDKSVAKVFLEANHSYGHAACRYCYGMFLKRHTGHIAEKATIIPGTLVAVATFSNARKWTKADKIIRSYEWTRYASLPEVRLSGGMGRMLKTFIKDVQPDDIMSYSDLEWSDGAVYKQLGFELEGQKAPVLFSIDTDTWKRAPFRKGIPSEDASMTHQKYFQNFGSNKYRLKLTEY